MTAHYVLRLNPTHPSPYQQKGLVNPLTHDRPELVDLVAEAIGQVSGNHLVKVTVQVEIIDSRMIEPDHSTMPTPNLDWTEENLLRPGNGNRVPESEAIVY